MKVLAFIAVAALAVTASAEAQSKKSSRISRVINHNVHVLANQIKARKKWKADHFYDKNPGKNRAPGGWLGFCGVPGQNCHVKKRSDEPIDPEESPVGFAEMDLEEDLAEEPESPMGEAVQFEA